MFESYELHHVDREELNEGRIWIRNESNKALKKIEGRRPVARFRYRESEERGPLESSRKGICCATLHAEETYLRDRVKRLRRKSEGWRQLKSRWRQLKSPRFGVCCETLYADKIYLRNRRYRILASEKTNLVILSSWYRRQLGIPVEAKSGSVISLEVRTTKWLLWAMWWQLRACARHPQIVVVMSTVLAVVGVGLGILGLAALLKDALEGTSICGLWLAVALIGAVVCLLGLAPLARRVRN